MNRYVGLLLITCALTGASASRYFLDYQEPDRSAAQPPFQEHGGSRYFTEYAEAKDGEVQKSRPHSTDGTRGAKHPGAPVSKKPSHGAAKAASFFFITTVILISSILLVCVPIGMRTGCLPLHVRLVPRLLRILFSPVRPVSRWREIVSTYLDATNTVRDAKVRFDLSRSTFQSIPILQYSPVGSDHAQSMVGRTAATSLIRDYAAERGIHIYDFQTTGRDFAPDQGSRSYYHVKDYLHRTERFDPPPGALITMVDVDYYPDNLPEFFARYPTNEWMLYTTIPEHAGGDFEDGSFWFNADGTITTSRVGGSLYNHRLWKWDVEAFTAWHRHNWVLDLFLSSRMTGYKCSIRRIKEHRYLVHVIPIASWRGFSAAVAWFVARNPLRRFNPVRAGFARFDIFRDGQGSYTSTGIVGRPCSTTIKTTYDTLVVEKARASKHPVDGGTLASNVGGDAVDTAALFAFLRQQDYWNGPVVTPPAQSIRRYQFFINEYTQDAKPAVAAFMSPLLNETYAPDICPGNDRQAVEGRVESVRPKNLRMTAFISICMNEFIAMSFAKYKHTLVPVDSDQVWDRQKRKGQRRNLEDGALAGDFAPELVKTFVKREHYEEAKDPRVISTINPKWKLEYSKVCYALAAVCKTCPWYAAGLVPAEIAKRVSQTCSTATSITMTDLSRYDGRHSGILRVFERRLIAYLFADSERDNALKLHSTQYGNKAVTTFGVKYDTGDSRLSGSPETSVMNTCCNAYMTYVAQKYALRSQASNVKELAFTKIGLACGDDGMSVELHPEAYNKVVGWFGHQGKAWTVDRGKRGVEFLARRYGPGVWHGNANSMCQLRRTLRGLHTAVNLVGVDPLDRMVAKMYSYYLTDAHTPIIGRFVTAVMRAAGGAWLRKLDNPEIQRLLTWNVQTYSPNVQYPNKEEDWMWEEALEQCPGANLSALREHIRRSKTLEELSRCPEIVPEKPIPPKDNVVVNGELTKPGRPKKTEKRLQNRSRPGTNEKLQKKTTNSRLKNVDNTARRNRTQRTRTDSSKRLRTWRRKDESTTAK